MSKVGENLSVKKQSAAMATMNIERAVQPFTTIRR